MLPCCSKLSVEVMSPLFQKGINFRFHCPLAHSPTLRKKLHFGKGAYCKSLGQQPHRFCFSHSIVSYFKEERRYEIKCYFHRHLLSYVRFRFNIESTSVFIIRSVHSPPFRKKLHFGERASLQKILDRTPKILVDSSHRKNSICSSFMIIPKR